MPSGSADPESALVVGGSGRRGGPGPTLGGVDGAVVSSFAALGLAGWTVPAVALGVPGLLVLVVVALQFAGAFAWLPVARRSLSGAGRKKRRGVIRY